MRLSFIRQFLQLESAGGIILFAMAIAALVLSNSALAPWYQHFFHSPIQIEWDSHVLSQPLIFWINDGLMTLFFLLVGLELKREFLQGELSGGAKFLLPAIAAAGGMLVPAIFYISLNHSDAVAIKGWAVPTTTDIAFSLGVLSLFGRRVPTGLKLFLMALAIFDDMGAIVIIAVFYAQQLSVIFILLAVIVFAILLFLNYVGVSGLGWYLLLGLLLWVCMLQSGIHPTVAGVMLALTIPLIGKERSFPLQQLEKILHTWVVYLVMPIFALANAGVTFSELSSSLLFSRVTIGIMAGLVLGKQLGIFGFSWLMIKLGWGRLPKDTTWLQIYGMAVIAGIGFTMSLFLGTLAFKMAEPGSMTEVKLGVLLGSLVSGLLGAALLQIAFRKSQPIRE